MKFLTATAAAAALLCAGAANAATPLFFEGFDGYAPTTIANGATGGTNFGAFMPAATSTTTNSISTDYSYRVPNGDSHSGQTNSMYDEGTWTIATNPFAVHDLWVNQDQPNDPFLILNGSTRTDGGQPFTAYESGNIGVTAGKYAYSYDILNVCCNSNGPAHTPSLLTLWYTSPTGSQTLITLSSVSTATTNGWQTISGTFDVAQPGGSIRIGLVDENQDANGNDFGVDNISLTAVPEPTSWALMILGFGSAGAMLRRRRLTIA